MKLADGKERAIQHMMITTYWHSDGTPMSAQQFMEALFGKLPDFSSTTKVFAGFQRYLYQPAAVV